MGNNNLEVTLFFRGKIGSTSGLDRLYIALM